MFTGLEEYYCLGVKSSIKPFVTQDQAVIWWIDSNDVTQWLSCIVGSVGSRSWPGLVLHSLLDSLWTVYKTNSPSQYSRTRYIFFNSPPSPSFPKPGAYFTHNATATKGNRLYAASSGATKYFIPLFFFFFFKHMP